MNKFDILKLYHNSTYCDFYHSPEEPSVYITTGSGVRISGYNGDDGIFYFVNYSGTMETKKLESFFGNKYNIMSIDYTNTKDGLSVIMVGLLLSNKKEEY